MPTRTSRAASSIPRRSPRWPTRSGSTACSSRSWSARSGERYQLIAGERRLRASIEAQLHEVPARVLDLDDQRVFELAMVENLQREDLNAIDKATAFREYLSRYGGTQEELAGRLGLDRSTVSNLIRLLELPDAVLDAVRTNEISQGHARALLGLPDAESRVDACRRVVAEHLSVRQTEALVSTGRADAVASQGPQGRRRMLTMPSPPIFSISNMRLNQHLGTTVLIRPKNPDRGQIIIDYHSREEFDRLAALFHQETGAAGISVMKLEKRARAASSEFASRFPL